jgi:uncharacterized protein YecT (DUF1311 family)
MHTIARVALVALVASAILAVQARAAEPLASDAENQLCGEHSQAGMRQCLGVKASESAAALKQAEAGAVEAIGRWDEDAKYAKAARAALTASSTAFAKYRERQCAYASALAGGAIGNAHEIIRLRCVTEMNTQRAQEVARRSAGLPPR